MKIRGLLIILLVGLVACQQNTEIPEFTNAEAVYIKLEKNFILHPDGSVEKKISKTQKILINKAGNSQLGLIEIDYNPLTDSVVIEKTEIQNPDGEIIVLSENDYSDKIPDFVNGSSLFSHLRRKTAVLPELKPDALITSSYTIYSKPGIVPEIMGLEVLTHDDPVLNYKLTIQVPKGQSLKFNSVNIDTEPKIKKKGKNIVYTWKEKNIDQSVYEPFGPKFNSDKKQILFSSADSLFDVFNTFTSQRAFTFETNAEMRDRVAESIKNLSNAFERVAALQKIVSEEIQTIAVPLYLTNYYVRPASETWESKSGTAEEKAVLLCALIRSTGWKASPVAAVPSYLLEKDSSLNLIGNLNLLEFDLIKFPASGKDYIISPEKYQLENITNQLPNHYFIPLEMGYSKVNLSKLPIEESQLSWDGDLELSGNMLIGTFDGSLMGPGNPHLGLKMKPGSFTQFSSGKGILEWTKHISTVVTFESEIEDAVIESGDSVQINLPFSKIGFSSLGIKDLNNRREGEFVLPYPVREFQRIVIDVPESYRPIDVNANFTLKNKVGRVSIKHTYKLGKISCIRNLLISETNIKVEDYQDLKALIEAWTNPKNHRVILRKGK